MNDVAVVANSEVSAPSKAAAPAKRPRVAPRPGHVGPSRGKSAKQAAPAKRAKGAVKSDRRGKRAAGARQGSKTAKVLELLKRSGGATGADLMKATCWQAHSVRGFISGVLTRKMGLTVTSTKGENGERRYSLKGLS